MLLHRMFLCTIGLLSLLGSGTLIAEISWLHEKGLSIIDELDIEEESESRRKYHTVKHLSPLSGGNILAAFR